MPSTQPTHHGYAVNVKDHSLYADADPLTGEEVQAIYDRRAEDFWELAQQVATDHGFRAVYSEGRMGGWAVPQPQPPVDDMWPSDLEEWERTRFRPFERDILALMKSVREEFATDLADAVDRAKREPAEAAHWAARDTITVDA